MIRRVLRVANRAFITSAVGQRLLNRSLVVFIYHDVSNHPSPFNARFGLNVRPATFARHLELIQDVFHMISPVQLLSGNYETPAALVTFDDGNLSYIREALPLLKAHGIPSVNFLNMGPIYGEICWSGLTTYLQHCESRFYESRRPRSTGDDFCRFTDSEVQRYLETTNADELFERVRAFRGPLMREDDLEALSHEQLVYLGNHLHNHRNATLLGGRLREEYRRNQDYLDRHPRRTRLFSYPFSRFNAETNRVLREEGVEALFIGGQVLNIPAKRSEHLYHRLGLTGWPETQKDLVVAVLRSYLPTRLHAVLRRIPVHHGGRRVPTP